MGLGLGQLAVFRHLSNIVYMTPPHAVSWNGERPNFPLSLLYKSLKDFKPNFPWVQNKRVGQSDSLRFSAAPK